MPAVASKFSAHRSVHPFRGRPMQTPRPSQRPEPSSIRSSPASHGAPFGDGRYSHEPAPSAVGTTNVAASGMRRVYSCSRRRRRPMRISSLKRDGASAMGVGFATLAPTVSSLSENVAAAAVGFMSGLQPFMQFSRTCGLMLKSGQSQSAQSSSSCSQLSHSPSQLSK